MADPTRRLSGIQKLNAESVQRSNLSAVLRLLHEHGPMTRAELTHEIGLNRSTILSLVSKLVEYALVEEHAADPTRQAGRPSSLVVPVGRAVSIGVNPEVDAIEIAAVALHGKVLLRERVTLSRVPSPEETAHTVAETLARWVEGPLTSLKIVGLGVAVPGLVEAKTGRVRLAPHLQWRDVELRTILHDATGLPISVGNDATLGTRAEFLFGAATGHDHAVYLNGGASGIGGGLIIDGRVASGASGYAGEWGQTLPVVTNERDRRVPGGTLESEVNRERLVRALQAASVLDTGSTGAVDDQMLAELLRIGQDRGVTEEVGRQRRILAATLANIANALNPTRIVLGGFLAMLADADISGFVSEVQEHTLEASAETLSIVSAELAENRLLVGAADLAFQPLLTDPHAI